MTKDKTLPKKKAVGEASFFVEKFDHENTCFCFNSKSQGLAPDIISPRKKLFFAFSLIRIPRKCCTTTHRPKQGTGMTADSRGVDRLYLVSPFLGSWENSRQP
jgi:hypothetical protein